METKVIKLRQKPKQTNRPAETRFTAPEWEVFFNAITDPIAIIDKNHNILKANRAVLEQFNLKDNQIIGQKCCDVFHKEAGVSICPFTKFKFDDTWETISREVYDKRAGKTYLISIYPRHDNNGKVKDFIHIIKDITKFKQAEEKMRIMAITDFLTGIYNQRHFYNQLEQEIERVKRYRGTFSLILFDIDEFKGFNDKYGHLEGDNALAKVGEMVKQKIRKIDSAYRYGGDEFVILMPQTNKEEAIRMAERLLESFRNSVLITEGQEPVYKTLSIGVTEYKPGDDLKLIIYRVDQAMYQAKKRGGDKVYVF
jgi:diguanylate cyclase (GGDEF)-like protein/PAS domain S-box-containing protein